MHVQNRGRDTMRVSGRFAHQRQGRIARRVNFADYAAKIELEIGFELEGKLLHALVVGKAMHLQGFDSAVARAQERALKQDRAHAVTLPGLLDAESSLTLA